MKWKPAFLNIVAPFGFFGAGNIGDESTLQGFARLVAQYSNGFRVWAASRDPGHTTRVEPAFRYYNAEGGDPRKHWALWRAQAQVVIGGTPIMDVLGDWPLSELTPLVCAAHARGHPVVFVGTGTERLQLEKSRQLIREMIAPKVRQWSVRCERDKERLVDCGVVADRITVASDLAWLLKPVTAEFGKGYLEQLGVPFDRPFIGVNVNNEAFVLKQEPQLFEKVAGFLDAMLEKHSLSVLFFCNEVREEEDYDKTAAQRVIAHMKHHERTRLVPNEYWAPQQMLSLIAGCQFTISTRYHFCQFSALQRVPFLALNRSDKVTDLCWDMNWPYGASLQTLSVGGLFDMASEIISRRAALVASLGDCIRTMGERVTRNRAPLDVLRAEVGK